MTVLSRRLALLGGSMLALAAGAPALAAGGSRRLTLYRGGTEIGAKSVSVDRVDATVEVETRIDIAVKLIGLTVYRYVLTARETWRDGRLETLRAATNDDGTVYVAEADRVDGALIVSGSEYSGEVAGNPATTSYWSPAFLQRPVWISTQDGRLLNVQATDLGIVDFPFEGGAVPASRWRLSGDLTDLFLYYDAAGEWVGTEFPARGETARFVTAARGPALTPLWVET